MSTNDERKTKKELIQELRDLQRRFSRLEKTASAGNKLDQKSRRIFENTKDAMIYLDKKGIIIDVNRQAVRIFGGSKSDLEGRHFTKIGIFSPKEIISLLSYFKTFLTGRLSNVYLRIKNKKRQVYYLECSASILKTAGKVAGIIVIVRDITERKKAEEEIKKSSIIIDSTTDAVVTTDLRGIVTSWNRGAELIYKYKAAEIVGKPVSLVWRKQDLRRLESVISDLKAGKNFANYEGICLDKDGNEISVLLALTSIKDKRGKAVELVGITKDITDRKRAEEALRNSEERFRDLAEMLPEAVFESDANLRISFANRRAFELFGYSEEDMRRGLDGLDMLVPPDRDRARINLTARLQGEDSKSAEYLALRKDGSTFPILFHASSIIKDGGLAGLRGIIVDITERKKVEEDLHYRLAMEELIMKISSRLIGVKPDDFDYVINQALRDLGIFVEVDRCYVFQYKDNGQTMDNSHEWCRNGIESLIDTLQDVPTASFYMVNTPQRRKKVYNVPVVSELPDEFRADREEFVANGVKSILCVPMLSQKEAIGYLGFDSVKNERDWSRDTISLLKIVGEMIAGAIARKKAVEALGTSEERYRQLIEHTAEGIVVAQDRFIKFVNPRLQEISSYSREELLSKPFLEFIHPDDWQLVIDNQKKRLSGDLTPETYEIRMINKYGDMKWLRIGGTIITWEGKPASLNFITDITETKRLKELESRAQRLEAAGQIAGQVAHDLNNLLAPLIAYPDFIREFLSKGHPILPYLNDMEKTAEQIADINQQLLTLGRRGHYNLEPMNLNSVISETVRELKPFPETLVIETCLDEELLNIKAGRAQIHRMLSNMIHNARDATQDIGRITIKTENFFAEDTLVAYGNVPSGEFVKLTISDTGHGISEDIIQKIFDPFFTTKIADKRRGSGLGLSVVDSVVKDHNGYIDLESKIGAGTTFYFYFPVTRENVDDNESEMIVGGSEKVLVVDDDKMQRVVTLKILNSLGYKATAVESGEKATDLLREEPHDLLILDMIMPPGIDGAETYERSLGINPRQKAIIVSGYAETDRVQKALRLGAGAFIRKPLTRQNLSAAIRKELNREEKIPVC